MAWFIDPNINHGYPWNEQFPSTFRTDFYSDSAIKLPYSIWRIKSGVNNGYPWLYWWFKEDTSTGGDMVIGGSQTNYPNGLTGHNDGYLHGIMDNTNMDPRTGVNYAIDLAMTGALSGKAFVINSGQLTQYLIAIAGGGVNSDFNADIIQKLYGANVYNSVVLCKAFPFSLRLLQHYPGTNGDVIGSTDPVKAFGRWQISAVDANKLASSMGAYWFDTISIDPQQAWEIESVDYSLYLPMAGVFPIDIRGKSDIDIVLHVSVLEGTGEYMVYINDQLYGSYKCQLASDIPVSFAQSQGAMNANFGNMLFTGIASGVGMAAPAIGGALGGPAGAGIGAAIGGAANTVGQFMRTHYAVTTPQIGSIASSACYQYPRLIAKIPKMFRDANGYHELLGANRSTGYLALNSCSGYVQCQNYKCDIIVATDDEKREIENLLNSGVFI